MKHYLKLYSLLLVALLSCNKKNNTTSCDGVMCTAMFGAITVKIVDKNNTPYIPDSILTIDSKDKVIKRGLDSWASNAGQYVVIDDNNLSDLTKFKNNEVMLKIYKDNVVENKTTFTVTADCCHVSLVKGDSVIMIP